MATSVSVAQAPAPMLTPQVAALFVMHGQETSTRSSGAQEQRGPKVDAALQLKQVAPAQNNESMINFVILNQISLFLYINLGLGFRV